MLYAVGSGISGRAKLQLLREREIIGMGEGSNSGLAVCASVICLHSAAL